ncbi:unnamed protein product [Rhodiola kirilowii]
MNVCEKRAKSEAGDEVDRISALPGHIRESILECLPIKAAMRTSLLARKWRYCWTGVRHINFDDMERENAKLLHRVVDRVLLIHSGPISSFYLQIPKTSNHRKFPVSDWFHVLSKNGIQDIYFDAANCEPQDFQLPSSLFQCRDLKILILYFCTLTVPPDFKGFYNLVDLLINSCKLPSHILGSLISQCPLLETLSLTCTCTEYSEQPLVIDALNLRDVRYEDDLWGAIIFKNVPKLTYVSLMAFERDGMDLERPCSTWGLICSLSLIKELALDISLLGPVIINVPRCLPTMFQILKTLTLRSVDACVEDHMRFVLCLIRSSPGLQDLTIFLELECMKTRFWPESEKSRETAQKLLETEAKEHCKLSNLKTVVLYWFGGSRHEIMLVKILLSRCPNLESFKVTLDDKSTAEDVRTQISREFEKYPYKDKLTYYHRFFLTFYR